MKGQVFKTLILYKKKYISIWDCSKDALPYVNILKFVILMYLYISYF